MHLLIKFIQSLYSLLVVIHNTEGEQIDKSSHFETDYTDFKKSSIFRGLFSLHQILFHIVETETRKLVLD
jgi:hypothetical protein